MLSPISRLHCASQPLSSLARSSSSARLVATPDKELGLKLPRSWLVRFTPPPKGGSNSFPSLPWLALACAGLARTAATTRRAMPRVDSHLHLWTPDTENFPAEVQLPEQLNKDGRATHENFVALMDDAGVAHAVVVQPVNYGQDYSYVKAAMDAHPTRLRGMFVADPRVKASEAADWVKKMAHSHPGWVGVRFNPYKWPADSEQGMADEIGAAMFTMAGELGLVVGFMPFKGLALHRKEIEALLENAPKTKVIIDHWGFFLQPALGFGDDRVVDDESWKTLLQLSSYPQVYVKMSALFRVSKDAWPFASLSDRFQELLSSFGSSRILWGSDFPYATEHSDYQKATVAMEEWPAWQALNDEDTQNILYDTASKLFGLPAPEATASLPASGEL